MFFSSSHSPCCLLVSRSFSLRPFLSVQAVSGISRPFQEPAGSPLASEPAGVGRPAFLWPSQPGEDTAGHGQPDCPARLELPLPWPGARPPLLQVPQWAVRGVWVCMWHVSEVLCLHSMCAYVRVLNEHRKASFPLARAETAYRNELKEKHSTFWGIN